MAIAGLLFLLALALSIGKRLAPREDIVFYFSIGLLTLIASMSIVGTLLYYGVGLSSAVVTAIILALVVTFLVLIRSFIDVCRDIQIFAREQIAWYRNHPRAEIAFALFVALFVATIVILARSPITDAVRSPWDRLPWIIFPLFFALSCIAMYLIRAYSDNPSIKSTIRIVTLLLFLIISIGWIAFPLGYGFDPFIHQATEKLIAAEGAVTPKPFYYIGQYSLVVILAKLLAVSVAWIDKLLVPILAALFIPWSILQWTRKTSSFQFLVSSFSILLLLFFLAQFTITTPQALANIFLVTLIFGIEYLPSPLQFLIATAALLTHPLAGIPAFIILIGNGIKNKKIISNFHFLFSIFLIPLAFFLASQFSSSIHVSWTPQNFLPWLESIEWGGIYRENRFHAPLDLLYFYAFNIKNIFWFFVLTAFIARFRNRIQCSMLNAQCFLVLLGSYILMRGFLSFNFLIGYEQADYANRVLDIASLFLIPYFLIGFDWWLQKIWKLDITCPPLALARGPGRQEYWKLSAAALLALAMTASLYLTYPQNVDSYSVSHFFNTGQADIDAVQWIENNAQGEPYIVLANQAVSAAAIHEFGFRTYYQPTTPYSLPPTPLYFYPIPTGSPLYQYYLDMAYPPKSPSENLGGQVSGSMRTTMNRAMDLVGVDRAYFVLNRYWVDFARIKKEADASANASFVIDDKVFIYEYHR